MTRPFALGSTLLPGLSKLMEEAGEIVQVGGKMLQVGNDGPHWDGSILRLRMEEDLGDITAAIEFFIEYNDLDSQRIGARAIEKLALFVKWHKEQTQ